MSDNLRPINGISWIKAHNELSGVNITCAIPSLINEKTLEQIVGIESVVSIIVAPNQAVKDMDSSCLGTFNHELTMWNLPSKTGNTLLFCGAPDQFGIKMLLTACGKGLLRFVYESKPDQWICNNTIILLFKKTCSSLLVRVRQLVSKSEFCLFVSRVITNGLSSMPVSDKLINILWDVNLKINYKSNEIIASPRITTPELFEQEYPTFANMVSDGQGDRLKVIQYIGGLYPGGAERQLCNLVTGINKNIYDVHVLTYTQLIEGHSHYEDLLRKVSVEPYCAGSNISTQAKRKILQNKKLLKVLNRLPNVFSTGALELLGSIMEDPPDILHAWLDQSNITVGIVGLICNVPIIILSTRNVNPNHFPYLANPAYEPWYKMLYATGRVTFINNSIAGAQDYSEWLTIPLQKFEVVHNGVDFDSIMKSGQQEIDAFKQSYGITDNEKIIAGVYRLSDEKQPITFIKVCIQAIKTVPELQVMIAGIGPLEQEMKRLIRESGYEKHFHFLGRYKDVPLLLSSADVLLHTSRFEGTPNAVLEAQWLGCPVVATKAGGTVDAVENGKTGYLVEVDDEVAILNALTQLLTNNELRAKFGQSGPEFIKNRFDLDKMVRHTVDIYSRELEKYKKKSVGHQKNVEYV